MEELTKTQGSVLKYIARQIKRNGIAPTIREIAKEFGYRSLGTVQDHLKALTRKGHLEITGSISRGLKVKQSGIPMVGYVQAGHPASENFNVYDYVTDFGISDQGELCALNIKGDSMKDAGILEGDIVIARKNPRSVKNNDIVIAEVAGEVTVKTFSKKGSKPVLLPANRNYKPIAVTEDTQIIGKVISIIRKYS